MATKAQCSAILIGLAIVIIATGCGKSRMNCANNIYTFQAAVKAYPDKDSIRVGDTIWIESNVPATLVDIGSSVAIDYSGANNLGTAISFDRFIGGSISNPGSLYAANGFKYILSKGKAEENNVNVPDRIKAYSFLESNKQYSLKVGIIPQQKGIYAIGFGNPANVYRNSDKCTKASYLFKFENTAQHLYLYQNNRPGYKIEGLELTNMYCFKVY